MKPGIYSDIPMADYVADPCPEPSLSTTTAHLLLTRSPKHAWWVHPKLGNHPTDDSSRADLGSAVHATLFGGRDVVYAPAEFNDWRKKAAQEFRDDARRRGQLPLLHKQEETIKEIAGPARERLRQIGVTEDEHTILWQGNCWARSRPDSMSEDHVVIVDYKTATNAAPAPWIRSAMISGGYDIQAGLVLAGLDALESERKRDFLFLVQEIDPPYCLSVIGLDPEFLEVARQKVNAAIQIWADCLKSKSFPSYDERTHYASPPTWAMLEEYAA